jgi:hypothetical protein
MKTVFCDLCGQQLTEAEVEGTVRLPSRLGELRLYPSVRMSDERTPDICWRCLIDHWAAMAPPCDTSGAGDAR